MKPALPLLLLTLIVPLLLIAGGCTSPAPAPVTATPATPTITVAPASMDNRTLVAFVSEAAAYARATGREQALAAFNDRQGPFTRGDLYIYALDYSGNALALAWQPDLVGTSFYNVTDASGRYFTRTEIALAQQNGGFLLYQYPDPAENLTVQYKISYVTPVDDTYWVGAGIYTREEELIDPGLRQFVAEAQDYAATAGRGRALAEFNNRNGSFIRGELYIFAYDYNGTTLAWPYRPDMIGTDRFDAVDPMGSHHIRTMIDTAKNGGGMVEYYSVNPASNTTGLKISYVMDVDGTWLVGAGRYVEPGTISLRG